MHPKVELSVKKRGAIVAEYNNGVSDADLAKKYKYYRRTSYYEVFKQKKYWKT